jgi:regulator of sirC expression with transglutaminase-like and TPR domain
MFENLKRVFLNAGELSAAQHCLDYQLILRPEDPALLSQLEALLKHSDDAARSGKGASRLH